jgi:hypothetical protein
VLERWDGRRRDFPESREVPAAGAEPVYPPGEVGRTPYLLLEVSSYQEVPAAASGQEGVGVQILDLTAELWKNQKRKGPMF